MRFLLFCISCLGLLYAADQKFWDKQDPSTWTREQLTQFTTASPWAKQVTATLTSNDSNMATGTSRGGGGARGRGGRGGGGSVNSPSPDALPKWQAIVRWASAPLMKAALKMKLPDTFQGRYVLSVSGLPIATGDNSELLQQTTIQLKRGQAVHPELLYQDPNDTSTIYFGFLPSMVDADGGKSAVFTMLAQPYEVKARFNFGEMKYRGSLAL
jgi:hypothetical protein